MQVQNSLLPVFFFTILTTTLPSGTSIAETNAALKRDGKAAVATAKAPTDTKKEAADKPCACAPPSPFGNTGGTAVINFVAPVSDNTMAELVRNAQNSVLTGADAVQINISSPGGSVPAIQFAVNSLRALPVPVHTVAMSSLASAAVALFCMGEKRYIGDGASLYLHQQRGYRDFTEKTAAAISRDYALNNAWYNSVLEQCIGRDADFAVLDYSSRDVVIDKHQAITLGMMTNPFAELRKIKIRPPAMNVVAPDRSSMTTGYPRH